MVERIIMIKKNVSLLRGFTLLEILIVIAIIGILTTMGTVAYTSAQKQARDGRRRTDLKALQNAFEQYYADNSGSYPSTCTMTDVKYFPGGFPMDPKSKKNYYTAGTSDGITIVNTCTTTSYFFGVSLESTTNAGYDSGCNSASDKYFCVKNLQ